MKGVVQMKHLSTKELNYVKDYLSWELLAVKKCYNYASQESNTEDQKIFFDAVKVHQNNYMNLLNYIQQFNNQQGGNLQ